MAHIHWTKATIVSIDQYCSVRGISFLLSFSFNTFCLIQDVSDNSDSVPVVVDFYRNSIVLARMVD